MSVRPVAFHANGDVDVYHDELGHGGTVPAVNVLFVRAPGLATADHRFVTLPCPVAGCGAISLHPIGGGADAPRVQELFVRLAARVGCPCGLVPAGASLVAAQAHIKLQTVRMDGAARWAIGGQLT